MLFSVMCIPVQRTQSRNIQFAWVDNSSTFSSEIDRIIMYEALLQSRYSSKFINLLTKTDNKLKQAYHINILN